MSCCIGAVDRSHKVSCLRQGTSMGCTLQEAVSELYSAAPSPAVPQLAAPPFSMAPPGSAGLHPDGLGTMRLSEETAGMLAISDTAAISRCVALDVKSDRLLNSGCDISKAHMRVLCAALIFPFTTRRRKMSAPDRSSCGPLR